MSPPFSYTAAKFLVYCPHIRHRLGGVSDMTMEVPKRKLVFSSFVWQDIEPLFKITQVHIEVLSSGITTSISSGKFLRDTMIQSSYGNVWRRAPNSPYQDDFPSVDTVWIALNIGSDLDWKFPAKYQMWNADCYGLDHSSLRLIQVFHCSYRLLRSA